MYQIIRSFRKTMAIEIKRDGRVIIRSPRNMPQAEIEAFVRSKEEWIARHLSVIHQQKAQMQPPFTPEELHALAEAARQYFPPRVAAFASRMGVPFGRITIRAQKSRWGSCSAKGNLNFNCLLMLCPENVRDYVIIHELCHRKELNHSPRFWQAVQSVMPDYHSPRAWLKTNSSRLIERLPDSAKNAD